MRWLLLKDLQILRRSPLQLALLVIYPIAIALLVGFALTRGPEQSTVALYNAMPPEAKLGFGGEELEGAEIRDQLCGRVDCVDADSRDQARQLVEDGSATAAVVIPEDLGERIASLASLNPQRPEVEVIVNGSSAVENEIVDDRIDAMLAEANLLIARRISEAAHRYLDLILEGGRLSLLGQSFEVLGLQDTETILRELRKEVPPGAERRQLERAIRFAGLATDNLNLAGPLLTAITQPIEVNKTEVGDRAPGLDTFAVAVTATFALMFVTVLLVAGSLALEREENAFSRLTAGLVTRGQILMAKLGLGTIVGFFVLFVLLAGLSLFVPIDWGRAPVWIPAGLFGAAAFAAAGAALGAAARDVRAATLAAVMIALPVALLSLVPDDAVGALLEGVIQVVTAVFPFRPALDALTAGLEVSGGSIWLYLLHLAVLTVAYSLLARASLRRF
ncbi:MAG: ABC transporter permease [Thermoleophilia bacterium]|nr:ABC transporter permease [Thermoleophilia bacterium]